MKWVLCNDVHLTSHQPVGRTDNVLEASLTKFDAILNLAHRYRAPVLVGGDLCERPRDWYLLPALAGLLIAYHHTPVYAVWGQHDMYMRSEENKDATTLGVLAQAGMVTLIPPEGLTFGDSRSETPWIVHGCSWGQELPWPHSSDHFHALVAHMPLAQRAAYPGHDYTDAGAFLRKYPYSLVLAGDVHRRFEVNYQGRVAVNTGPILRVDADDYNRHLDPAVALFDTEAHTVTWYTVPAQPGTVVLSREHIEAKEQNQAMLADFIAMVKQPITTRGMPMVERVQAWVNTNKQQQAVVTILEDICLGGKAT